MAGIDRRTGKVIGNFDSAVQGVDVILTTRIGSRVMRREFGGGIVELLGRAVTPRLFAAWQQLIGTAIDLWEPRFHVRKLIPTGSANDLRRGAAGLTVVVDWRPHALSGDFTVETVKTFSLLALSGRLEVVVQ